MRDSAEMISCLLNKNRTVYQSERDVTVLRVKRENRVVYGGLLCTMGGVRRQNFMAKDAWNHTSVGLAYFQVPFLPLKSYARQIS